MRQLFPRLIAPASVARMERSGILDRRMPCKPRIPLRFMRATCYLPCRTTRHCALRLYLSGIKSPAARTAPGGRANRVRFLAQGESQPAETKPPRGGPGETGRDNRGFPAAVSINRLPGFSPVLPLGPSARPGARAHAQRGFMLSIRLRYGARRGARNPGRPRRRSRPPAFPPDSRRDACGQPPIKYTSN